MTRTQPSHVPTGRPPGADRAAHDVLVVGAGPAGSAAAIVLARQGWRVTVLEQRSLPRHRTCGGALSPAALRHLAELDVPVTRFHRIDSISLTDGRRRRVVRWPVHPELPDHGVVAPRHDLDMRLVERARESGAVVLEQHEAIAPIVERGFVYGAQTRRPDGSEAPLYADYTVVADGANSRFGRALGTHRDRAWPMATAVHTAFQSPRSADHRIEISLALRHGDGHRLTGYGWVFPVGDGTIDVGVGVVSTSSGFRSVNTTHLLDDFCRAMAAEWRFDPGSPLRPPASGRVPMGGSVGPIAGPTMLVVGDAGGTANPLSGSGIDTALESGRLAGEVLAEALRGDDPAALQRYPRLVADRTAALYQVGRLLDRMAGRSRVMDRAAQAVVGSDLVSETVIRLGTRALRPGRGGPPEQAYRAMRALSLLAPDA